MRQEFKGAIAGRIRAIFNDRERGEEPVQRRDDGLFGPRSMAWRVHGDVTAMMVGGVSALLLQMLHPAVLAGVWDHSAFRHDMLGRLRRTARFIALTTFGGREEAEAAIARVREIHARVHGTLPDGTAYAADDPALLDWVHVTEAISFLDGWQRYGDHPLTRAGQDRYCAEAAVVARGLGVADPPVSRAGVLAAIERARPELVVTDRTREVARLLLGQPAGSLGQLGLQRMVFQAAIDLLPLWARRMHGLRSSRLGWPLVAGGTQGVAQVVRWAFR